MTDREDLVLNAIVSASSNLLQRCSLWGKASKGGELRSTAELPCFASWVDNYTMANILEAQKSDACELLSSATLHSATYAHI